MYWTIKFALANSQNLKKALVQKITPTVCFMEKFWLNLHKTLTIIAASSNLISVINNIPNAYHKSHILTYLHTVKS